MGPNVGLIIEFILKLLIYIIFYKLYGGGGGTLLLSFSKSLNIHHNIQYLLDFIAQQEYSCNVSNLIFAWYKCVVLDTILLDKSLNTWYNLR